MKDDTEKIAMTTDTKDMIQRIGEVYGPYAFGVISLLVIWFAIVKPELDNRTVNLDSQREFMDAMRDQSRSIQVTAAILERTVERLAALESSRDR